MQDTLKVVDVTGGFSDTVLLAIIAALLAIATLIIKSVVDAKAKKAEAMAKETATKLDAVEVKIDGRLTEILRLTKLEAEERAGREGKAEGKAEEKAEEKDRKKSK